MAGRRQRVVVVGVGFAGFRAVRGLVKLLGPSTDVVAINQTDYFLYLPLMPQVGGGLVEPRHICVSLPRRLRSARFVIATVDRIDVRGKRVYWTGPDGVSDELEYDRLVLTAGSVNKLLPIPGVVEHAHGFRSVAEAIYLRDHITRQIELAAITSDASERRARRTFVVVGAGYTGTEMAAQGQLLTTRLTTRLPALPAQPVRWLLLDTAPRVLPELDPRLSKTATRVLQRRGVEVRTGQSVTKAEAGAVVLSTGERVETRSLIWCVGVRPDPLVQTLELSTTRGRLDVDEYLTVPGLPDVFACGDCAAVPDVTRPGELCGMTAQHAQRQGELIATNVAASLGVGTRHAYRHHDLGFLVDLGGAAAAANPLGIPISGPLANAVTRGYHLYSMPGNRGRVATDWALNAVLPQPTSLGLIGPRSVPLDVDQPSH
jgi:NADH dehydrogenase